ncbi:MAG: hypothetical protein NC092_07970 [Butyrivibrio sp.]|nr:hypothetical protein [Muribaculum sp.]MCM1552611.1 hypothetical protein [Butyrivibrio sp.]
MYDEKLMLQEVSEWLDAVLENAVPNEVVAYGFNVYDGGDHDWSMELVGTSESALLTAI